MQFDFYEDSQFNKIEATPYHNSSNPPNCLHFVDIFFNDIIFWQSEPLKNGGLFGGQQYLNKLKSAFHFYIEQILVMVLPYNSKLIDSLYCIAGIAHYKT